MSVTAPPPPSVEIDDGVIEEARRRQRRRRLIGAATLAAVASVLAVVLALAGGGTSANTVGRPATPPKLTFVHGQPYVDGDPFPLVVFPYLQAGNVGLCVAALTETQCGWPYPAPGEPIFGNHQSPSNPLGPHRGQIDYELTQANVAAVRVPGVGTLRPVGLPGLPPGYRAVVFYRPPGTVGAAATPIVLDHTGRVIPDHFSDHPVLAPYVYWNGWFPEPAAGRCALSQPNLPGPPGDSRPTAEVATKIISDKAISGPAFFTCLQATYGLNGPLFQAAVLLNAQSPGRPPAPLWGTTPVPGHPGIVQTKTVQWHDKNPYLSTGLTSVPWNIRTTPLASLALPSRQAHEIASATVARRDGNAWLVVSCYSNNDVAQAVTLLDAVHITRISLPAH